MLSQGNLQAETGIHHREREKVELKCYFPSKTIAEDTRQDSLFICNIPIFQKAFHYDVRVCRKQNERKQEKETNIITRNSWLIG